MIDQTKLNYRWAIREVQQTRLPIRLKKYVKVYNGGRCEITPADRGVFDREE